MVSKLFGSVFTILFFAGATSISAQNPQQLGEVSSPGQFFELSNGRYIFSGYTADYGKEPWVSDGTLQGTFLLKDVRPGSASSFDEVLNFPWATVFDSLLFFNANDGSNQQLWISNGTPDGTKKLIDTTPDVFGCCASFFPESVDGKVFFVGADNSFPQFNLWVTDGTQTGTLEFADSIQPSSFGSLALNNILYFFMTKNNLVGIWRSDGTPNGTYKITNTMSAGYAGGYNYLKSYNNKIYFAAYDSTYGNELWSSDGTISGTSLVKDLTPGVDKDYGPKDLTVFQNQLFFTTNAIDSNYHTKGKLWRSDGTSSGTSQVVLPVNLSNNEALYILGQTDNYLYFRIWTYDSSTHELWRTDGSDVGTIKLKTFQITNEDWFSLDENINFDGNLYFVVTDWKDILDGPGTSAIWRSDGTSSGTYSIHDNTELDWYPPTIFSFNKVCDSLFFEEYHGYSDERQLWVTDGVNFNHLNFFPDVPEETSFLLNDSNRLFLSLNTPDSSSDYLSHPFLLDACNVTTSVSIVENDNLNIFPNPTNDILNIQPGSSISSYDPVAISLYDLVGKVIYHSQFSAPDNKYEIQLGDFPSGIYILKLESGTKSWAQKIVKE